MSKGDSGDISFRYTFMLNNDRRRTFKLLLDRSTLALRPYGATAFPNWTDLSFYRCPNCALNERDHSQCPIAVSIIDLVDFFKEVMSYDRMDVEIATDERSYIKHTTTSEAVSSLLGIYMVTSGCPVMNKLRPMVRFHLPFATVEETTFRAVAMYLVAQHFVKKYGGKPDWALKGLHRIYKEVRKVNHSFVKRLQKATVNDASINALIRLDAFATVVVTSIDLDRLRGIEALFGPYLK